MSVMSGCNSQQVPHDRFQYVDVGEGIFHHVSGCEGLEEVARERQSCTIH